MNKIFVSYCHHQGDWVWKRLTPCLKAGGAEILIDRERFELGKALVGQMDATQDQADKHLLVLSDDYLKSSSCRHEMDRAIALDPDFKLGIVIPVLHGVCTLPPSITGPNPLYADLRDDRQPDPWTQMLQQCGATQLRTTAPAWLAARDNLARYLERNQSVNLVVDNGVNWRALLAHLVNDYPLGLAQVNLEDPDTASRRGLLAAMARALGERISLPDERRDLSDFKALLKARSNTRVVLTHFDLAHDRSYYDVDLFAALRFLMMDMRKLTLLVQSRTPFAALLPKDHPLSDLDIKTVELRARP
ncbi:MAG: toll/interleukin-1 receptor domain-containing protein [Candidatus Competibacteraceae bacterium]|nr:toll/interleukin-1 receptor domain-containing protein [Candidatus Competibacteraceae bacterium]